MRTLLTLAALLIPSGAASVMPLALPQELAQAAGTPAYYARPGLPPLCRAEASYRRGPVPNTYDVTIRTVAGCPKSGEAYVRMQSGRLYPWHRITPALPVTYRGISWFWRAAWRAGNGRAYYLPLKMPPWRWTWN